MDGLAGEGSHLDLFTGLPDSPSSWVVCRVLLRALVNLAGLGPILEEVLVEVGSLVLLPALTQVLGVSSASAAAAASSGASLGTAVSCPCVAVAAPTMEVPERYFVSF